MVAADDVFLRTFDQTGVCIRRKKFPCKDQNERLGEAAHESATILF